MNNKSQNTTSMHWSEREISKGSWLGDQEP